MQVTIWDMDYYYAKKKVNCFNPDAMKISSYHKQKGDSVNFVLTEDDIFRPFDIFYLIKENEKTPNPPAALYVDSRVKWWGKAVRFRIKWKMSDVMLACRPDYLLYPEKNTKLERSEQIRLMNDNGELLPLIQDWTNTFKNKSVLVTDTRLWTTSRDNLKTALKKLAEVGNVSFFEPIWIQKLMVDQELIELFLNLKLNPSSEIHWLPVKVEEYQDAVAVVEMIKAKFNNVGMKPLPIKIYFEDHWQNEEIARNDFEVLKKIILDAKHRRVRIVIKDMKSRLDSPYFELFENLSNWTTNFFELSWLEYITKRYGSKKILQNNASFWAHPDKWNDVFRNLLRQTYMDADFLLTKMGKNKISDNEIPWELWRKEFKYGL